MIEINARLSPIWIIVTQEHSQFDCSDHWDQSLHRWDSIMSRLNGTALAFAVVLPLLSAAGCASQDEMSALRTEVMTSQDMARAAQSEAAAASEEARKAAAAAQQAAEAAQRAADEATRAAKAAEDASAKAERIYQESLRK